MRLFLTNHYCALEPRNSLGVELAWLAMFQLRTQLAQYFHVVLRLERLAHYDRLTARLVQRVL